MDLKVSSCGSGFIKNPELVKMTAYVDGIVPLDIDAEVLGSDLVRNNALRYELEKNFDNLRRSIH